MDDYKAAYEPLADKLVKSGLSIEAIKKGPKVPTYRDTVLGLRQQRYSF